MSIQYPITPPAEGQTRYWSSAEFSLDPVSMSSGFYNYPEPTSLDDVYVSGLRGSNWNDTLTGGATEDWLEGRGGADSLSGNLGMDTLDAGDDSVADYLDGGHQSDSYWNVTSLDTIIEDDTKNGGYDSVTISSGSYTLAPNVEELTLVYGSNATGGSGNNLANYLGGNEFGNLLYGAGGNDSIHADMGDDVVYGDAGHDQIDGNQGADQIYGGAGNDSLDGSQNSDTLNGGAGDDTLNGGDGPNTLIGGAGNDLFWIVASGEAVKEALDGGSDEERFTSGGSYTLANNVESGTVISGGASITGNGSDNTLAGDALANELNGAGANDMLFGNEGQDTLLGGAGNDALLGGAGNDTLNGGDGVDSVQYGQPGGSGGVNASLATNTATDTYGNTDTFISIEDLYGSEHDDLLAGNASGNYLSGYVGDDTLAGGAGKDSLDGGEGTDTFRFAEAGTANADEIFGMAHGGDRIELDNAFFTKLTPLLGGGLKDINFVVGTAALDPKDFVIYDPESGKLYYDRDGSGTAFGKNLIATIANPPDDLAASDFRVI